ncbi:peptide ABC transporter substrate-binding protein [Pasteurellaceae bacterium LIM206]|nr:peptide ABC transporter substrate-binding protein [Pasteurellaceae bacterium LIM206]
MKLSFSRFHSLFTQSAVLFSSVLLLSGCDNVKAFFARTVPDSVHEENTQDRSPAAEDEAAFNTLLRGVYHEMKLNVAEIDSNEQADFLRDLLEGLVIYDKKGDIRPAVAEGWSSQDGKIWRFNLRRNAYWSNGTAVTAQDFVRGWRHLIQSQSPLKQYFAFMNITNAQAILAGKAKPESLGVEAIDDKQLQISLDKSTPYLPKMLAHIALLPQFSGEGTEFVGNGAYRLAGRQADTILLSQNENYWDHGHVHFPQVQYKKLPQQQAVNDLDFVADVVNSGNVAPLYFPKLCTYFYEFNFNDPYLKQSAVRNSLVSMVSSGAIVQGERLPVIKIDYFVPRNMESEQDSSWEDMAVENVLKQSGISESHPLHLKLTYDQEGIHGQIANRLIRDWSQSELITVQNDPVSWQQLLEKRSKGDYQIIRSGWCADYNDPSAFFNLLYSKNPDNKTGLKNAELDQLIEQSWNYALSAQEREAIYQKILTIAHRERVFLPIFQYSKPVFIKRDIAGYDVTNPTEIIYSKDLYRRKRSELN